MTVNKGERWIERVLIQDMEFLAVKTFILLTGNERKITRETKVCIFLKI
jgi:hypothetical protein